ncbi:MAG: exosortase system-associated protein, TIGR04073 family [Verrucomicrobiota bacterium]
MKYFLAVLCCASFLSFAHADLQMPPKPNFYDKMGSGIANILYSPAEILDSTYEMSMVEGPTAGYSVGLVRGISRMVMDIFVGTFDIVTSPLPTSSIKTPALDSGQVEMLPPADLLDNWY